MLLDILPDHEGPAHVDIEGANDALLWDLHTLVQHVNQINRYPFSLVAREEGGGGGQRKEAN